MTQDSGYVHTREMQNSPTGNVLAVRLRAARERASLSQQVLATRAGISMSTLSRIESGEDAKLSILTAIAEALGVTVIDLISEETSEASS